MLTESFNLHIKPLPFEEVYTTKQIPAGLNLEEALIEFGLDREYWEYISLFVGKDYVFQSHWKHVKPKAGKDVYLKVVPGAPGVVSIVASIAGAYTSSYLLGAAAFTGLFTNVALSKFVAYGIGAIVTFAISALFTPKPPSLEVTEQESPTRSLTSARNDLRRYAPVPVVLGRHKMVPPYGAAPYTEVVGDDQYLRFVVVWGYGPVNVTDIKIGNTDINNFEDVEVEHDFDGTLDTLELYPNSANQENLSIAIDENFQTRTTEFEVDEIGVTLTFPNGLYVITDSGDQNENGVTITIEYKKTTDSVWTTQVNEQILDNTTKLKRVVYRITGLDRDQYDIRIKRDNPPGTFDGTPQEDTDKTVIQDECIWSALRSFRNEDPIQLSGVAKSAFRIRATDQLNGIVDQINGVVTNKIPFWDGNTWNNVDDEVEKQANPASVFRYILTGSPNNKAVASSRVDDDNLGAWYETCERLGLRYSRVIDYNASVRDLLEEVAAAGLASPTQKNGKWGVIVDAEKVDLPIQHFTPRNTYNFQSTIPYVDIPEALRVRFINSEKDWQEDEYVVFDDGFNADNTTEYETIEFPGVVIPGNAYRLGRYYIASAKLRPEIFTFGVDFENLIAERGDVVKLTFDEALIGQTAARIKSINGNIIGLDDEVTMEADKTYQIRVRPSGLTIGDYLQDVVTSAGTTQSIVVEDGSVLNVGELVMFGETGKTSISAIVKEIEPEDDLKATLTCVPYNAGVYLSAVTIPDYEANISTPVSRSLAGPPTPNIVNVISDERSLTVTPQGDVIPGAFVYVEPGTSKPLQGLVEPTDSFYLRYRPSGSAGPYTYLWQTVSDNVEFKIVGIDLNISYEIGAQALGQKGGTSNWTSTDFIIQASNFDKPANVDTLEMVANQDGAYLEWTHPNQSKSVVGYEVRYNPNTGITDWYNMTPLSDSIPRDARTYTVPSLYGSYGIKAVDLAGNRSETAVFVNSAVTELLNYERFTTATESPSFAGSSTFAIPSYLLLESSDDSTTDRVQQESGSVLELEEQVERVNIGSSSVRLGNFGSYFVAAEGGDLLTEEDGDNLITDQPTASFLSFGSYTFANSIDLGGVVTTKLTAYIDQDIVSAADFIINWTKLKNVDALDGAGGEDFVSSHVLVSYSSDNVSYSDYQKLTTGDYTARYFRFRLFLETEDQQYSPSVTGLYVAADLPVAFQSGQDIASGAGTYSVSFDKTFRQLDTIVVTGQNLGSGDYYTITNKTVSGFDVTFYNSGGSPVDRTFDYYALGYGTY